MLHCSYYFPLSVFSDEVARFFKAILVARYTHLYSVFAILMLRRDAHDTHYEL
jgi:hypothetical protein